MASTPDKVAALAAAIISHDWVTRALPKRAHDSHKGNFGHVLIIGGDYGFGGAAIMAAQAALHCGAGLVSLFTRPEHIGAMLSRQPEVMVTHEHFSELLLKATVLTIGPGLGKQSWGQALLAQVLASDKTMLLDADALNYLAMLPQPAQQKLKRDTWVLTPHPGEAARLLGCSTTDIQQNRMHAVQTLQQRFGGTILLKGHNSLICGPDNQLAQLTCGNPGMASAGMGDVLSGVISALLAQGLDGFNAAAVGGWLHSSSGDALRNNVGEHGLLATELLPLCRKLLNQHTAC